MTSSSKAVTRLMALVLAMALMAAMVLIAMMPFLMARDTRREISASAALLTSLRRRAANADAALASRKMPPGAAGRSAALLAAATTGVAGADLQKLLIELAQRNGGLAKSARVLDAKSDGDLIRISVGLTIRTDITALRNFLFEVETRTPLLFVDQFALRLQGRGAMSVHEPGQGRPLGLDVTMQVSGYMQKEPGS